LALEYAIALADRLDAKVHILNVLGLNALQLPDMGAALPTAIIDHLVETNQAALARLVAEHEDCECLGEVLFRTGDPRDVIDTVARELRADLIVMGSHGRHRCDPAVLGSVAESVLRAAPCPVLIARPTLATFADDRAPIGVLESRN
jgi:nucleotide-binding universal stress UspA family protein